MRNKLLAAVLTGAALIAAAGAVQAASSPFPQAVRAGPPKFDQADPLADAVNSPSRSAENRARDGARHPLESLEFWGVGPSQTVLDVDPAGGYWAEILVPFEKSTGGTYIGTGADLNDPAAPEGFKAATRAFQAKWGVSTVPFNLKSGPLAPAGTVDFIMAGRTVHNWMWQDGMVDKAFADFYAALRPGGVLAIEEHRADPRAMIADARDGYVSEAFVIGAAQKAGFVLESRSDINANPKDSKDHPFGVWSLPPTRRSAPAGQPANPAFDHSRFDAIGESDRMTLRFRKPG